MRRFDKLHVRSILTLQDHLAELEEKLDAIDEQFSLKTTKIAGSGPPTVINCVSSGTNSNPAADATQAQQLPDVRDINNGTIRDDMPERAKLVSEVLAKLTEYGKTDSISTFHSLHSRTNTVLSRPAIIGPLHPQEYAQSS